MKTKPNSRNKPAAQLPKPAAMPATPPEDPSPFRGDHKAAMARLTSANLQVEAGRPDFYEEMRSELDREQAE